jgi:tRNA threonylcarbamoyladenosine biosynthesis protein TsaB
VSEGLTLAIESSTYLASCALFAPGATERLAEDAVRSRGAGGERLLPAIDALLRGVGASPRDLTRVLCGAGPGSFTSLRVGASIAKGLARASGASLEAVPSLLLVVDGEPARRAPGTYLAVVDAMRGERFAQPVEVGSDRLTILGRVRRIGVADVRVEAARFGATTIGPADGAELPAQPHARGALRLAGHVEAVDLAAWEPQYGRLAEAQAKWEAAHGRPLVRE